MNFRLVSEKTLFLLVAGIHLIPLLNNRVFFTIDGPAHIYNAKLIYHLLFSEGIFNTAFWINPESVPNWTGHLFLVILNFIFKPLVSEKLLQIILVAGIPLAFRFAVSRIHFHGSLWSYFIFPFSYSFVFINGFYNFCFSLLFFFLAIGVISSFFNKSFSFKKSFLLFLLFLLTYFSHPFTFLFLVMAAGLFYMISYPVDSPLSDLVFIKKKRKTYLFKGLILILVSAIPIYLLYSFLSVREHTEESFRYSYTELVKWIWQLRPLILFSWDEVKYTQPLFFILIFGFLGVLFERCRIGFRTGCKVVKKLMAARLLTPATVFLILMIVSLCLYFTLPDTDRNASFISVRLCMMFFLFFIIWLSQTQIKRWIMVSMIYIVLSISFIRLNHINRIAANLNRDVASLIYLDRFILPEKVIIPLDISGNWLYGHLINYIAIHKPVLLLENYEASKKYFPVLWKEKLLPDYTLGKLSQSNLPCLYWKTNPDGLKLPADYVLVNGHIARSTDDCIAKAYQEILSSYEWVTNSEPFTLYRLKEQ
ncbi:MAG: hypothetical protein JNL47_11825 [Bacteroidia bacterium]|nr:hypothetical protein [Bacteroidia bacterium]